MDGTVVEVTAREDDRAQRRAVCSILRDASMMISIPIVLLLKVVLLECGWKIKNILGSFWFDRKFR